jgi:hypothetical protein
VGIGEIFIYFISVLGEGRLSFLVTCFLCITKFWVTFFFGLCYLLCWSNLYIFCYTLHGALPLNDILYIRERTHFIKNTYWSNTMLDFDLAYNI